MARVLRSRARMRRALQAPHVLQRGTRLADSHAVEPRPPGHCALV
jgi:hypothetical protein